MNYNKIITGFFVVAALAACSGPDGGNGDALRNRLTGGKSVTQSSAQSNMQSSAGATAQPAQVQPTAWATETPDFAPVATAWPTQPPPPPPAPQAAPQAVAPVVVEVTATPEPQQMIGAVVIEAAPVADPVETPNVYLVRNDADGTYAWCVATTPNTQGGCDEWKAAP